MQNKGLTLMGFLLFVLFTGSLVFFIKEGTKYRNFNRDIGGQVVLQIPQSELKAGFYCKARLYNQIGCVLARYRDTGTAEAFIKAAHAYDPQNIVILQNLSKIYWFEKRIPEASGVDDQIKKMIARRVKQAPTYPNYNSKPRGNK